MFRPYFDIKERKYINTYPTKYIHGNRLSGCFITVLAIKFDTRLRWVDMFCIILLVVYILSVCISDEFLTIRKLEMFDGPPGESYKHQTCLKSNCIFVCLTLSLKAGRIICFFYRVRRMYTTGNVIKHICIGGKLT